MSLTAGRQIIKLEVIIMSKGYTEIVYILDRSGSMGGLEADTVNGIIKPADFGS